MNDITSILDDVGEVTKVEQAAKGESEIPQVAVDSPLYRVERSRASGFDDEVLYVRQLASGSNDYEALLETDNRQLELEFYNEETPNQWNIQLFWVYDDSSEPDEDLRREFESKTRFAIRRCVSHESLREFLCPLEYSRETLSEVNTEFGRDALIQRVTSNGLGFLFDQSTSRDEKFDDLLDIDTNAVGTAHAPSPVDTTDDRPSPVDTVELGDFRDTRTKRELDASQFTLLYGRNGSGKTSLLDGITMGLVGQTRRDEDRIGAYDELSVTLEGDEGPLSRKSKAVNDRVADWFGFRPQGRADRYIEFYRVNYHEAGETTRLLESPSDLKTERVFRNFLYGEDLAYATDEKDKLTERVGKKIETTETEIEGSKEELKSVRQKRSDVRDALSTLGSAQNDLSPAAAGLVEADDNADSEQSPNQRLSRWRDWQRRFETLETAIDATTTQLTWETAEDLRSGLVNEVDLLKREKETLENIQSLEDERRRIVEIVEKTESEILTEIPFSTFFTGLLFGANGISREDTRQIVRGIEETDIEISETELIQSTESWYTTVETALRDQHEDLEATYDRLAELNDLEERRRELREQIRADTEEYLKISDDEDVRHCPACYVEQSAEDIRTREKPEHTHDTGGIPDSLTESLDAIETALDVIETVDPAAVDDDIRRYGDSLCDFSDVRLLFSLIEDGRTEVLFSEANTETVETVAKLSQRHSGDKRSVDVVFSAMLDKVETTISQRTAELHDVDDDRNRQEQIQHREDKILDIRKAIDVLDEQWSEELRNARLRVAPDRRTIKSAVKAATDATVSEPVSELSDEIEAKEEEITNLRDDLERLREMREHLVETFEDVEQSLNEVLSEYTKVVTTLFKVFQRPYEFERVELTDKNNRLRVIRRGTGEIAKIDEMSSGQRTALILAIFVTNNLAHDTAPPVMLLDEPFAHLDQLNTLSFFNLIIELAVQGDRQILFATANDNLASLLERKVGETEAFDRVDLETSHL